MDNFNKILKENREKRNERIRKEIELERKKRIKENILFGIIAMFIITTTLILLGNLNEKEIKNCQNMGYDVTICLGKL